MKVRVVSRDGYRLRVTSWGSGGPHVIVLPGLSADARSLAPEIRAIRPLVGSTHVIDLPGSVLGPALMRKDATFANLARYVGAAADELGIRSALIVGHSLGGGLALHLGLERPELVDGLVLIAPAALGRSLHWIYKLYCIPIIGRALLKPQARVSKPFVRRFLIGANRRGDEHFLDTVVRLGSRSRDRALSARAIVWANQPSWWRRVVLFAIPGGEQLGFAIGDRLRSLPDVPTMILWGSEDRVICPSDAARLRAARPEVELHVARGAGHLLPLEAPAWTNAYLRRFVATLQRAPMGKAA